ADAPPDGNGIVIEVSHAFDSDRCLKIAQNRKVVLESPDVARPSDIAGPCGERPHCERNKKRA
ncbi:MAG TPA: hypothetical protein VMV65_07685, partial [Alphaproteobacteria bacterium]|nr:hypothetical protein [Alphaproteobacteria bacterium]